MFSAIFVFELKLWLICYPLLRSESLDENFHLHLVQVREGQSTVSISASSWYSGINISWNWYRSLSLGEYCDHFITCISIFWINDAALFTLARAMIQSSWEYMQTFHPLGFNSKKTLSSLKSWRMDIRWRYAQLDFLWILLLLTDVFFFIISPKEIFYVAWSYFTFYILLCLFISQVEKSIHLDTLYLHDNKAGWK